MKNIVKKNIQHLKPSSTLVINEKSKELIKKGKKVYQLGFGQSPFPVPEKIINIFKSNAHRKEYLPIQGLPELREAISKYLLKIVENEGTLNLKTLLENEKSNISKNLRNSLIYGKNIEPITINNIKKELKELKNKVKALFESYDLIIMPTTPQRAFEIKTDVPKNQANFTSLANICDLPSISLPYYYKGKLPYSLQLLAPNKNDHFLLRISSYFEEILQ